MFGGHLKTSLPPGSLLTLPKSGLEVPSLVPYAPLLPTPPTHTICNINHTKSSKKRNYLASFPLYFQYLHSAWHTEGGKKIFTKYMNFNASTLKQFFIILKENFESSHWLSLLLILYPSTYPAWSPHSFQPTPLNSYYLTLYPPFKFPKHELM